MTALKRLSANMFNHKDNFNSYTLSLQLWKSMYVRRYVHMYTIIAILIIIIIIHYYETLPEVKTVHR